MRDLNPWASCSATGPRSIWPSLALLAVALLQAGLVRAQEAAPPQNESVQLRSSPRLQEQIPAAQRNSLPTFLFSDFLSGRPDLEMTAEGRVELRRGDTVIRADRLEYYQPDDLAKMRGHVRINRAGNVFEGPQLELKVDAFEGFFTQPDYRFLSNDGYGKAERADFLDENRAVIRNATFTTCQRTPGPSWMPAWLMRAATLSIDNEDEVGEAKDAKLSFKGVTFLSVPSMSFPLSEKRKSGFLSPIYGVDTISGNVFTVPYYWNIAPNRDATLYPTLMTKRGINWGGEFRYLEPIYKGQLRVDYMPSDKLRDSDRWGYAYLHQGSIVGVPAFGTLGVSLNLNRVSDDNYWRDFPNATTSLTQRLLANDATLSWGRGLYTTFTLRTLKWQTLQSPDSPITPPYDRLPQLTARYARLDAGDFEFSIDGDYNQFVADRSLTGQPNSQRSVLLAQISRPWLSAAGFFTPKLQLHSTSYQFDAALSSGSTAASRAVPTFSLDTGLVFERDASYLGRAFRQTLEPRLFYVNTPYVDQSYLPNYDSGANDFNFASIYTENAFVGHDRISDSNLLTAGVTTRLLDPETGAETARFGIAQRYRFADQNVTMPGGTPIKERLSDVLLGAGFNWDNRWAFDSVVQYNPTTEQSVRSTVGARYRPGNYRVINLAYRFQRDISELVDVSWQWPLNNLWGDKGQDLGKGRGQGPGRWYSVGRLNFSMKDDKLVDSIVGFEYDGGCWLGRIVLERLQTGLVTVNERIMFQLELVGFSRVGMDPLSNLQKNVPHYQFLREQTNSLSRFSNYD